MAVLKNNGKELVRLSKEEHFPEGDISYRRVSISYGEKFKILEKIDVVFRSDNRKHTWGWKVKARHPLCPAKKVEAFYRAKGFV